MEFGDAVKAGFQKYFDFSSRSIRSEYWWWTLFVFIASIVLGMIDGLFGLLGPLGLGPFGALFSIATLVPGLALSVRRLHDVNRSGWWLLLLLVPLIGALIILFWAVSKGDEGPNDYGPNPLDAGDQADAA